MVRFHPEAPIKKIVEDSMPDNLAHIIRVLIVPVNGPGDNNFEASSPDLKGMSAGICSPSHDSAVRMMRHHMPHLLKSTYDTLEPDIDHRAYECTKLNDVADLCFVVVPYERRQANASQ